MKKLYLILLLCCLSFVGEATTYYSYGTGDATTLSTWWTGTTGTGSNPTTFANPGDIFIVQTALTIESNWTIGTPGTYTSQLQFNIGGSIKGNAPNVFTIYGNLVMNDGNFTEASLAAGGGAATFNIWGNCLISGPAFMKNQPAYNYIHMCNTSSSLTNPQLISNNSSDNIHTPARGLRGDNFHWSVRINIGSKCLPSHDHRKAKPGDFFED